MLARCALLGLIYAAVEAAIVLLWPGNAQGGWPATIVLFALVPFACGALGRRLGLSLPATQASVLAPAFMLSLLMLPFLTLGSMAQARSPWAGGMLHAALTGLLLLGTLLGFEALCALAGWNLKDRLRRP